MPLRGLRLEWGLAGHVPSLPKAKHSSTLKSMASVPFQSHLLGAGQGTGCVERDSEARRRKQGGFERLGHFISLETGVWLELSVSSHPSPTLT